MSVEEQLQIVASNGSDRLILTLEGELDLASARLLANALAGVDLDWARAVVLDLGGLRFLDSTGLREIFKAQKAVHEGGRRFAVTRCSPQVQRLLHITRLDEHLDSIETPESELPEEPLAAD